ncbi:MAG: LPS-assembly protein LptD, partial [Alphaproteobacteria bacterium]|nr:LPS-assembly protein LptD [Alphaproteobacteria bacterium]
PRINILYSPTQKRPFNNIYLIDSPSIDISDVNIFNNSRYSGTDFREEGFRISYGVNNHISDANWDVGFFIGQALSRDNNTSGSKSNYVGRAYLKLGDNMNLYYSFLRRAANFKPVRDELSINLLFKKIKIDNSITFLREIKEQAMREGAIETIPNRSIRQSYSKISINLNDNLTLFGDMRVDFSRKGYPRPLNQAIGMSYNYDCVAFTIRLNENYAHDTNRGITKTSSHSATIGLKSINM